MTKTGLIGHPVSHTKSPLIHEYWMKEHNIEGAYDAIDVAPENLEESLQHLIKENYKGFNVTVPHKETVMPFCDDLDETAQVIGAVNTLTVQDGYIVGRNTDAFGFIKNMDGFDVSGKTVMVLGAGGAAKAAFYGLQKENAARIILTNRTQAKAKAITHDVIDWEKKETVLADIDLLVNTTSLGMTGKPPLEINLESLNRAAKVYDIVYAPLMTDLLQAAQKQGNAIITGIGMLFHQARPAFKAWHGVMPDIDNRLKNLILS